MKAGKKTIKNMYNYVIDYGKRIKLVGVEHGPHYGRYRVVLLIKTIGKMKRRLLNT